MQLKILLITLYASRWLYSSMYTMSDKEMVGICLLERKAVIRLNGWNKLKLKARLIFKDVL